MKVSLRSAYDDHESFSEAFGLDCEDASLADQSQAEAADINVIVRNFGVTGEMPQNVRMPLKLDFVESVDFQSAMNAIIEAERSFGAMPARVRERFSNDPQRFLEWCDDPDNLDEAKKLGLVKAPEPEPVIPTVKIYSDSKDPGTGTS